MKWTATAGAAYLILAGGCDLSMHVPESADTSHSEGESDDSDMSDGTEDDGDGSSDDEGDDGDGSSDDGSDEQPDDDTGVDEPQGPLVRCEEQHYTFPNVLPVVAWVSSSEPIESYHWQLRNKPADSTVADVGPDAASFDFEPDVEGVYEWCLSASTASSDSGTTCCALSAFGAFAYEPWLEESTTSLEDVELASGSYKFAFTTNQPVAPEFSEALHQINGQSSMYRETGVGTGERFVSVQPNLARKAGDAVLTGEDLVHEGDVLTVKFDVTLLTGETAGMEGTVVLGPPPEPAADAPVIAEAVIDGSGTDDARIRVHFAPDHTAGNALRMGGWHLMSDQTELNDDGVRADEVAGDGWYTGSLGRLGTLFIQDSGIPAFRMPGEPGSYSVLMRARSSGGPEGASFRTTVEIPAIEP